MEHRFEAIFRNILSLLGVTLSWSFAMADPLGSNLTYRGQLEDQGQPANGVYDFTFSLYSSLTNTTLVGVTVTNLNVDVTAGSFAAGIDFGITPFDGTALWLEIAVRKSTAGGAYTVLSPRQTLEMVPFAAYALNSVTPSQFSAGSNALAASFQNSILSASNALAAAALGNLGANDATGSGLSLVQSNDFSAFPLTILGPDNGTNTFGYTLNNGYDYANYPKSPYPIAVMRPNRAGASMPFDLVPNGPDSDVWIDLSSTDLWTDARSAEYMRLRKHSPATGGYGEITMGSWGKGKIRNLVLQPFGGYVGLGYFTADIQPALPVHFRPSTDNNLGAYSFRGMMTLASFTDRFESAPLLLQGSSISFSTDNGVNDAVNISHNSMRAKSVTTDFAFANQLTVSGESTLASVGIGTGPDSSHVLFVHSTNQASLPWPGMSSSQRDAIQGVAGGGTVYNTEHLQPEWSDGGGRWYRFGQRPAIAVLGGSPTNTVSADMDVILVNATNRVSVVFPSALDVKWRKITVKDIGGSASVNPVVVSAAMGKMEAKDSYSIVSDFGSATFVSDGANWWKIE